MLQKEDLLLAAQCKGEYIIISLNFIIKQGSFAGSDSFTSSLLNQKSNSCSLVEHSQFALVLARPTIDEDSVSFYEYLVDIDHQTATVAQSVRVFYPLYHCVAVRLILRGRAKVSRTESVSFFHYCQIVMRDNPIIIDSCHLLDFVFFAIVVDGSGARAKQAQNCINLLSQLSSNQIVGVGLPDGENTANCKIIVDDGAAIQRIIGDDISFSFSDLIVVRFFLACKAFHQTIFSEVFFNDIVALHILVQLLVSKQVAAFQFEDGRVAQKCRNFHACIQDALNHHFFRATEDRLFVAVSILAVFHVLINDGNEWADQQWAQPTQWLLFRSLQYWPLYSNNQKRWARLSIYSALPTAKERRSSNEVTSNYIRDFLPDVMLFPPAFSIKNPTAAASYNALSLHLCDFDPMLLRTPFPLMKICPTSGTKPPVYLRVQPFLIHPLTTLSYYQFQFTARKLPGLNIFDFSLIVRCQCETIHSLSIRVSSCTIFFSVLQMRAVVLGPQMVITALTWSPNLAPIRLLGWVFQMEKMLPIAKFVSMIELPSSGSQVTTNPSPSPME